MLEAICWLTINISTIVIELAKDVSFTKPIKELDSGGRATRKAWGKTIRNRTWR